MENYKVYDDNKCELGEGIFWHPERRQVFWFDIMQKQMRSRYGTRPLVWQFDEYVSAAGWIDIDTLIVASETALSLLHLDSNQRRVAVPLEADNPQTRSNDGRADPWGGYWIGTMGKLAESGLGSIYRFYRGTITKLYRGFSIPNSICFDASNNFAYFSDTPTCKIMRQSLDDVGWPQGSSEIFIDTSVQGYKPDGAIIDALGYLWCAHWGSSQISRYNPDGELDRVLTLPVSQPSCPSLGGSDLSTLFFTSAREGLSNPNEHDGKVWCLETEIRGVPEFGVRLSD